MLVADALRDSTHSARWYRGGTGDALIELLNVSLSQNATALTKNGEARRAVLQIAADLAERNFPAALTLQERIKLLRV